MTSDVPRMFAVSPVIVRGTRLPIDDEIAGRNLWRFMRPLATDKERIAAMANALRQWCVTVESKKSRDLIYDELGISCEASDRLDSAALRRLQSIIEKEKA